LQAGAVEPDVLLAMRNIVYEPLDMDLIAATVVHVCQTMDEGAILCFLPGWSDITKLNDK